MQRNLHGRNPVRHPDLGGRWSCSWPITSRGTQIRTEQFTTPKLKKAAPRAAFLSGIVRNLKPERGSTAAFGLRKSTSIFCGSITAVTSPDRRPSEAWPGPFCISACDHRAKPFLFLPSKRAVFTPRVKVLAVPQVAHAASISYLFGYGARLCAACSTSHAEQSIASESPTDTSLFS
jgi:hypothetical protein